MLIFLETYFWLSIIPIGFIFLMYRKEDKTFFLFKYFPTYWHYFVTVLSAIYVGVEHNAHYQFYCNPVIWSKIGLTVGFCWVLIFPLIKKQNIITCIFSGWSIFCMVYLILFGSIDLIQFIVLNTLLTFPFIIFRIAINRKYGIRLLDFLNYTLWVTTFPFWLAFWLIKQVLNVSMINKIAVVTLPSVLIAFCVVVAVRTNNVLETKQVDTEFDHYVAELYYGTHWKYHTRICLYDGWRPPFHDPIVVLSRLFMKDKISWEERMQTYQELFPQKPLMFDCRCGENQTVY